MQNKHIVFLALLLFLADGCAQHSIQVRVVDSLSGLPIAHASGTVQRHDYSLLNSKGISGEAPIQADQQGIIQVPRIRRKDTLRIQAPDHQDASLGFVDGNIMVHSPTPTWQGNVLPALGIQTNAASLVTVPLVQK